MWLIVDSRRAVLRLIGVVGQCDRVGSLLEVVLEACRECVLSGLARNWKCHIISWKEDCEAVGIVRLFEKHLLLMNNVS